jgi:hypothetical protein
MAKLRKISEVINGKLPSYNSAFLNVRGLAIPLDIFLKGSPRFAKKLGSEFSIWSADNTTNLTQDTSVKQNKLFISPILPWIAVGSKLRLNNQVFGFVDDIVDSGFGIILKDSPVINLPTGSLVELYGHPLEIVGTYSGSPQYPAGTATSVTGILTATANFSNADTILIGTKVYTFQNILTNVDGNVLIGSTASASLDNLIAAINLTDGAGLVYATATTANPFVTAYAGDADTMLIIPRNVDNTILAENCSNASWSTNLSIPGIILNSDYKIYQTDEINVGSFSYKVVRSKLLSVLDDGRYQFQVLIEIGITSKLEDGRTDQAYLRAHPAYESTVLHAPTAAGTVLNNVGPFLYDRVSGPFFTDMDVEETDIVTLYDSTSNILSTTEFSKNELISGISIPSDAFLFWDKVRGSMQWDGVRQAFVSVTDKDGFSHIHFKCVPLIKPGYFNSWRCLVETTVNTTMTVELEPNTKQQFILPGGVRTAVIIDYPAESLPIERIHVLFQTEVPGSKVYMKNWEVDIVTVSAISHTTIAKVSGSNVWASSGAFAKPYFLRLEYIKAQVDLLAKFDSGLIVS